MAGESESGWRRVPSGDAAFDQEVRVVSVSGSERQLAEAFLDHGPMSVKLAGQRAGFASNYATILCRAMHVRGALVPADRGKYELNPGTRNYLQARRAQDEEREREREKEEERKLQQNAHYTASSWPFD